MNYKVSFKDKDDGSGNVIISKKVGDDYQEVGGVVYNNPSDREWLKDALVWNHPNVVEE